MVLCYERVGAMWWSSAALSKFSATLDVKQMKSQQSCLIFCCTSSKQYRWDYTKDMSSNDNNNNDDNNVMENITPTHTHHHKKGFINYIVLYFSTCWYIQLLVSVPRKTQKKKVIHFYLIRATMSLLCRRSRACNPLALGVLTVWHRLNIILCYSAVSVALWLQSTLLARWSWLKQISESLTSMSCTADEWYTVPEIQSSGWQIWIKMGAGGREVRFGPLPLRCRHCELHQSLDIVVGLPDFL